MPEDDAHHLDVASGTGEPGFTIAAQATRGSVVLSDPSAGRIDVATRAAAARGIDNVEFHACGADEAPSADATFDGISCRFGLRFFPDITLALGELARVLKPGGKLCTAVWAQPEGNPRASIPVAAIATETEVRAALTTKSTNEHWEYTTATPPPRPRHRRRAVDHRRLEVPPVAFGDGAAALLPTPH